MIKVRGLTINEFRNKLYDKIIEKGILTNPNIDIKLLNANVTLLGEVNKPGTYSYNKNNMNFFEAIGMAGDLTINGKRDDIKLIREENGKIFTPSISINWFTNSGNLSNFFRRYHNCKPKHYQG